MYCTKQTKKNEVTEDNIRYTVMPLIKKTKIRKYLMLSNNVVSLVDNTDNGNVKPKRRE